ncbi:metal ABC transporter substrate-binding protein [Sulfurimonas diazotrophicus]|uniref:Metal ABC transporter substrate-binding protein n=1 Tax=Sulfurimonas diazotrophicus TaxID=3131939 RepID=A0ABZ3H9G9_9BACT
MKKAIIVLLALLTLLVLALVVMVPEKKVQAGKADVVVTTFALYDIARHLLGQEAEVAMLIPFGREVHTFEPTPQDMIRVQKSRLFLYSGAGLEPWTEPFESFGNAKDMSRYVRLREGGHAHHDEAGETHEEDRHSTDPHYWLDIDNMIALVRGEEQLFTSAFPALDVSKLRERAAAYIKRLETLDTLYRKRLSDCRLDTIVVSHNAFGYLAERYGFHVDAVTGLSPDTMPDARTMTALTDIVREHGIKTLFYESFVSDKLVASLATETGVRVDVLQPLANITADEIGADYFRLMNANLLKLHDAMECK